MDLLTSLDSPNPQIKTIMSEELKQVADLITANTIFTTKEVLTSDEAARYLGISKSYLYKLTMQQKIPHYKPMGKKSSRRRKLIACKRKEARHEVYRNGGHAERSRQEDVRR